MGNRSHNFRDSIKKRFYFIRILRESGCFRFSDFFKILFTRNLNGIQSKVINRLSKAYEKMFSLDMSRSSVRSVSEVVKEAQKMLEGIQPPN